MTAQRDAAGTAAASQPGREHPAGATPPCTPVDITQTDHTLDTASRMLLRDCAPVRVADLAASLGETPAALEPLLAGYEHRGRLKRDGDAVVASLGVSALPSEYQMWFGERRMWAWCAKTALGVVSALGLGGRVAGRSPLTGAELSVTIDGAAHTGSSLVMFWPADTMRASCGSAELEYCPSLALFEDAQAAWTWAHQRGFPGEVVTLREAVSRSREYWAPILDLQGHGSDLAARLSGRAAG